MVPATAPDAAQWTGMTDALPILEPARNRGWVMANRIEADGDTWEITVDRGEEAPGVNAVVFHCVSNPQRPYRVTAIGGSEAEQGAGAIGDARLRQLFGGSQVMGFVHDRDALQDVADRPDND
ncbi:MAG: hypothetical protein ACRELX_02040 [Longimicrobiales bacterium]